MGRQQEEFYAALNGLIGIIFFVYAVSMIGGAAAFLIYLAVQFVRDFL